MSTVQPAPYTAPKSATNRRWIVVVLLALASIVAYMDRVNLSVALIDVDFKSFFGLTNTDRGLANSAFFWSYAVLQIPAGWLVDRFGSKYPIAIGFAVWSLLTAITALTTGFSGLFFIRMLLGVAEAVIHPASMRWIRFNFSEKQRGLAIGLFMSGSKFGPAIGATVAAWLIQTYGWRAMFILLGCGAMLWLLPWLLLAPGDRKAKMAEPAKDAETAAQADTPMIGLFASPVLWGTIIGTFCYMYFVYFCLTWMPAYFNEARHLSLASSSLYTTFSFAGMAVVSILGGWGADRLIAAGLAAVKVRKAFTIIGFLIATTVLVGAAPVSANLALAFSVVSLSGLGLATANYWALTQTLIPSSSIGRIVGIQNCAASVAGIVAPILTGWLVDVTGNFDAPIKAVSIVIAIGIAAYLFLVREKYAPVKAASPTRKTMDMWRSLVTVLLGVSLGFAGACHAGQTVWHFDNLKRIGGYKTDVDGQPQVVASPVGKALRFDGVHDSLLIEGRPLVGASTFTVEAVFKPEGGPLAQRFMHIAETDPATGLDSPLDGLNDNNARFMFEIRVVDGCWYLDTYLKSKAGGQTLAFPEKKHPLGHWYAVAQTYDGKTYRAYVDGELQGEAEVAFTPHGPGHIRVGARMNKAYYFTGAVAEARFTDHALRPDELLRINTPQTGPSQAVTEGKP